MICFFHVDIYGHQNLLGDSFRLTSNVIQFPSVMHSFILYGYFKWSNTEFFDGAMKYIFQSLLFERNRDVDIGWFSERWLVQRSLLGF